MVKTENSEAFKKFKKIPEKLYSCHTGLIDNYFLEGHIPAEDIRRLLREKPDIAGLAVPGMPVGSPGMEQGDEKEPYDVMSVDRSGNISIFSKH